MTIEKPAVRPQNPRFSSGPCAKIPGWAVGDLGHALTGRSHRSGPGKARLKQAIALTREVLEVPPSHLVAIVPASDTGAVEMALWSLLGARGVDLLAWESFGAGWVKDVVSELKLPDVRVLEAPYSCNCPISPKSTSPTMWCSPGTAPPRGSGARRRLDSRWPPGPHHLRRHLRRLCPAARLRQARCRHLLLAEGAGRRGGPWHAGAVAARRRAARDLAPALAAAQDLPPDQGRQARPRDLRGRDHQHPIHAVRRGLDPGARMGPLDRWSRRLGRPCRRQCRAAP